ncbi:MAG: hypothetical protein GC191_13025 [Azospirillum sp.]|nr:hypothetical protein [Azospirillum sp.]
MRRVIAVASIVTAIAVTPVMVLAGNGGASGTSASSSVAASAVKGKLTGKHVTLRVGRGFNPLTADSIARILEENGCPATVTTERGLPNHIGVEVDGKVARFTEAGSAGAAALRRCQS